MVKSNNGYEKSLFRMVFFTTLLENRVLTSVIKDFQHQLLTDVESIDVESNIINIVFIKVMLT